MHEMSDQELDSFLSTCRECLDGVGVGQAENIVAKLKIKSKQLMCDECGLPMHACNALAMHRSYAKAIEEGDIEGAKRFKEYAEEAESDYRKEREAE